MLPHVKNRLALEVTVREWTRHRKRRPRHRIRDGVNHAGGFEDSRARQPIVAMNVLGRRHLIGIVLDRRRGGALDELGRRSRCPRLRRREVAPEASPNGVSKAKHPRTVFK